MAQPQRCGAVPGSSRPLRVSGPGLTTPPRTSIPLPGVLAPQARGAVCRGCSWGPPHLDVVLGCLVHNDVGVGVLLPLFWTGTRQSLTPEGRPRSPPSTGLGPGWATGGWRGGQGHCSAAPGGHPQKAALLPRPGRPLGLGTAHRPGVRRGGGADLPSAGCLASPHPANCQLTPRPPWGPLPSGLAPCPKAPRAGEPGLGQSWGADAWRSAPWDRVAAGSRAVLTPTPVSPKHRRGGLAPSRVPFPRGGCSAGWGLWGGLGGQGE